MRKLPPGRQQRSCGRGLNGPGRRSLAGARRPSVAALFTGLTARGTSEIRSRRRQADPNGSLSRRRPVLVARLPCLASVHGAKVTGADGRAREWFRFLGEPSCSRVGERREDSAGRLAADSPLRPCQATVQAHAPTIRTRSHHPAGRSPNRGPFDSPKKSGFQQSIFKIYLPFYYQTC
jgi:hypothetical protein